MYLISIYFDNSTNKRIYHHIHRVADRTANTFMTDQKVPPHITIASFESRQEDAVVEMLKKLVPELTSGTITWASVGTFFPYVIYLAPVLNYYLHDLSCKTYQALSSIEDIKISPYYRPFQWIPHTTIGKKLSKEEMLIAFQTLQNEFGMFHGQVTRIGLAKTNPYQEIINFDLTV